MINNLDDFLLSLKTNNYSKETIYNYERDLKVFESYLGESSTPFKNVNKKVIAEYKAYLVSVERRTPIYNIEKEKILSAGSVNRMLSSLRSFFKYLIEMDFFCPVPPEVVQLIRTEKKHSNVAEINELVKLIESPSYLENDEIIALRNRVLLEVLFSTGLRISELCSLNRADIDNTGKIFITGKGKKQRFVYLTPRAQSWLNKYLETRNDDYPALFIPYAGLNVSSSKKRLSANYIQMKIKQYREKLKINVPTSAHSLRHGFATYLAESGASPVAIQILLGHESLDTTTRYVHASDHFAQESHRKFHPLSEERKKEQKQK